jgi:GDP-4-dehydro-6-deoxy-D-mannose reductase
LKRKIFITGATGFVGRNLIRQLDSPGNEIFGTSFPHQPTQIETTCLNRICFLDITHSEETSELIAQIRPDWVFHLAAVSNVKHSWEHRMQTLETNLLGSLSVMEAVRKNAPDAKLLFVSSSNVYGMVSDQSSFLTEDDPIEALSPYAYTKISGELLARFYAEVENMDVLISRTFPHTGPGQSPDFVCSDWAYQIARIENNLTPPQLSVGNLEVTRDYSDVMDVVSAYESLMKSGRKGQIYNIGSGRPISLHSILDLLLSFSDRSIDVLVDPGKLRKTDIPMMVADISKVKAETGWAPRIPLESTLKNLLDFWRRSAA